MPAGEQVGQRVEASAVRQWRDVEHRACRQHLFDVRAVLQAHGHQIAVRQHRAFWHAGGSAGVEDPGQVVGLHRLAGDGRRGRQSLILVAVTDDDARIDRLGRELLQEAVEQGGTGDDHACTGVGCDWHHFAGVQLGIDRHRAQPGGPDSEKRLKILTAVFHIEQDTCTAGHAERAAQATCQAVNTVRHLPEREGFSGTGQGVEFRVAPGADQEGLCDVHLLRAARYRYSLLSDLVPLSDRWGTHGPRAAFGATNLVATVFASVRPRVVQHNLPDQEIKATCVRVCPRSALPGEAPYSVFGTNRLWFPIR